MVPRTGPVRKSTCLEGQTPYRDGQKRWQNCKEVDMKLRYDVITDFNGIVIFEPDSLIQFWGGQIQEGTDLYTHFMSSDDGDEVIKRGIIIPILAITDAGYGVEFYINEKSDRARRKSFLRMVFTHCM
jgi:hypothetical protein